MKALACALFLSTASFFAMTQEQKDRWKRVFTGADSIVEVDVSKVTFGSLPVARVRFRTILSKPEALPRNSTVQYKTRIETIEFKCQINDAGSGSRAINETRYRLYEGSFLNEKGQIVKSFEWQPSEEWKEVKFGSTMERLSAAACKLISEKRQNP